MMKGIILAHCCTILLGSGGVLSAAENNEIPSPESVIDVTANVWPVMVGMEGNGILKINTPESLDPNDAVFTLDMSPSEKLDDIESVTIRTGHEDGVYFFDGYKKGDHVTTRLAPALSEEQKPAKILKFKAKSNSGTLAKDSCLWVSLKMKPSADMSKKVGCRLVEIQSGNKVYKPAQDIVSKQRVGYTIAQTGNKVFGKISPQGKPSIKNRIPGLARTQKGNLIAVFDARYDNRKDMPSNIDIVCRRSSDGGKTWSPISIVINYTGSEGNPKHPGNLNYDPMFGASDPAILVDEVTGHIFVAALTRFGIWGSNPGITDDTTTQFVIVKSEDEGKTWSPPVSLNFQCKDKAWKLFFQGPGHGITMKDRGDGVRPIVFPAQIWDGNVIPHSCIVYSEDHGKTWKCEEQGKTTVGLPEKTSECSVVQLSDGSLMLNARNEDRKGFRSVHTTKDMGKTWEPHPTNLNGLREPVCQGSVLAVENMKAVPRMLLFSNPDVSPNKRMNMTLKASFDEGMTWPKENKVLYDSRPSCGYSDICMADKEHIGIVYEGLDGDENLFFLRIPVKELLGQEQK